jgi:Predicted AAA-ATPase/PD-(D/E)XK nuclease superfamily
MSKMSAQIPIGIDDFSELVSKENHYLFVDKSLFIKEVLEDSSKVSLIIRPRRWGKTINMSMLQYFFAPTVHGVRTQGLFDHLNIAKEDQGAYLKHQGKHPVIFVSFKSIKQDTWESFYKKVNELIIQTYSEHEDILVNSPKLSQRKKEMCKAILNRACNQEQLENALQFLSECLEQHYAQKVIILIDEYDTPLNMAYERNYLEAATGFFKNLFGAALKGNRSLEKGLMTGILRLSKNNMLSDLNNLLIYSMKEPLYSRYFGFSEQELVQLFSESGVSCDLPNLQRWYNGYRSGDLLAIYNPWSILNCIKNKGFLDDYWIKTGDEALLSKVFIESESSVKEKIHRLIAGEAIESGIDDYVSFDQIKEGKEEVLWSLLWALGYLKTIDNTRPSGILKKYRLAIPNYEVETSYRKVFIEFIRGLNYPDQYEHCLSHLIKGEVDAFARELQGFMLRNVSYLDCSSESNYHMLLLGMSSYLKETHRIFSNLEQGLGRPDLLLVPLDSRNTLGIILEFKRAETGNKVDYYQRLADKGLAQINEKHYDIHLKAMNPIKQILKLCIVFYGKELVYQCVRESL